MTYKTIIIALTIAMTLTNASKAQAQHEATKDQQRVKDSTDTALAQEVQREKVKDDNRMADAKLDRKETKAKAKNAQRIENEANTAARESRYAVRSERKAQKSRNAANKQAEKAKNARIKSDKN